MRELGALRYEPTEKRIRAELGAVTVVDCVRALLVWEPRRVVPAYAVPIDDVDRVTHRLPNWLATRTCVRALCAGHAVAGFHVVAC